MSIGSKNMAAETREVCRDILLDLSQVGVGNTTDIRVYPSPSTDWRLVGGRWEVVAGVGANFVMDIKDPGGNAAITQVSVVGPSANGVRGTLTLSSVDAYLEAHGSGTSGNGYHSIQVPYSAGGKVLLQLYYRRVQPSGSSSKARLS